MQPGNVEELAGLRAYLLRFAMLRLRNRERAEDAVQETLLAGLEGLHRFAGESSLRTWLGGILKHKIADCLRGTAADQPIDPDDIPGQGGCPVETLERGIHSLPPGRRQVFILSEIMDLDTTEICRELSMSRDSVWVSLHRARRRLRECPELRDFAAQAA